MKIPDIRELTLREKIGQTIIFNNAKLQQIENPKEYFTNNPIGSTWILTEGKENYKIIETELGNPELLGRKEK